MRGPAVWGVVALLLTATASGPAAGQERVVQYRIGPFAGTVVDSAGVPVAGAKVLLIGGQRADSPTVLQELATDAQGRFQIAEREFPFGRGSRGPGIVVEDARGRIGGTSQIGMRSGGESSLQQFRITLQEVKEYRGRLVGAAGRPIVKARIKPTHWLRRAPGPGAPEEHFEFSSEMVKRSSTETDAEGKFLLRSAPTQGRLMTTVTAAEFGAPLVWFTLEKPVTIALDRPGTVRATLSPEGTPGDLSGVTLMINASSGGVSTAGDFQVSFSRDGTTDKAGACSFEGVPPGKYALRAQPPDSSPFVVSGAVDVEVKPGEGAKVSIPLKRAIAVRGKVIDKKTGQGLKDVDLYFYARDPRGSSYWGKSTKTDAQGAFTVYVRPGKITANIQRIPDGYLQPGRTGEPPAVEVTGEMTWPTIELEPAAAVEGLVVDEAGKPVPGAEISSLTQEPFFNRQSIKADQGGKFVLKQGAAKTPLPIRVRTGKAVSDGPVVVVPGEAKGPVKITVSEKNAFALKGTVVDETGRPLRNAPVQVETMWRTGSGGIGFRLLSVTTNEQGGVEVRGLWPGDQYNLLIEAEGHEKCQTPHVAGAAGKTHDCGKIVVDSARGTVEGRVLDSAGKPLAGLQVFNAGDAPAPLMTTSDAEGRFRLAGFRAGPVWVFVKGPQHRFTGARVPSGSKALEIRVLRKGEPIPTRPAPAADSPEVLKQLVGQVLERLWKAREKQQLYGVVSAMAHIDPERAMEWSRQAGGNYDRSIRSIIAPQVAETDLEEAFSLVAPDGTYAFYPLKTIAERLAGSDRAKAMRCAEEAAVRARSMDQPSRAVCLAQAGSLVVRLGNPEAGRKLIDEAAQMAERMGAGEGQRSARGEVAACVAAIDPDRAMKLIEPITDQNERNRYRVNAAIAAAAHDLAKAQAMLKDVDPWYVERTKAPIAYHLAQTRPEEALRFLDADPSGRGAYEAGRMARTKAEALGWIAVTLAPRDKARAWALIDQALELVVGPSEAQDYSGAYGGRAAIAAFLAARAKELGYPDMESVVWRVLASRATSKDSYSPGAVVESHVVTASLLALADPSAAREMLQSVEPRLAQVGSGGSGVGRGEWHKALVLADPRRAIGLIERELAAPAKPDAEYGRYELMEALQIATLPPPDRLQRLARRHGFWFPGEER